MNTKEAYETFRAIYEKIYACQHALELLYTDGVTAAPAGSADGRGKTSGILSQLEYELHTSADMKEAVACLIQNQDELTDLQRREIIEYNRRNEFIASIPADEYVEYRMLINKAEAVWRRAKPADDFAAFAPYLEKIFAAARRFALYYRPNDDPYDTLLDMYERGLTQAQADVFFGSLREKIVPLLRRVMASPEFDDSFMYRNCPIEAQRRLSDYLLDTIGVDREYCSIAETEHPFTTRFNKRDVRVTTHYYENNFASSMYSVIHEGGHALYELGSGDEYEYTCLAGGISMGIHESQSRLFENMIGRSREYIELIFPKLRELFPEQLADVGPREVWLAVNKSRPSLIRTEADELTYPLHIMVRYELEREIIAGRLSVYDLPAAWAEKYREYLGIDVPDNTRGVLQDSHWSGGMIGYFPSYALGSAYAALIMAAMRRELDVSGLIRAGRIKEMVAWLTRKIYRHGCMYDPAVLLESCCGEPFNPDYYTDYLEEKYNLIIAELGGR